MYSIHSNVIEIECNATDTHVVLLEQTRDGREVVSVIGRQEQLRLVAHPLLLDGHVAVHLPFAQVPAHSRRPLGAQRLEVPVASRRVIRVIVMRFDTIRYDAFG